MNTLLVCILLLLILIQFRGVFTRRYDTIWSPMTIISAVYLYYIVWTYYTGGNEEYQVSNEDSTLLLTGALISYVAVLIGFNTPNSCNFRSWNRIFSEKNLLPSAVLLFSIGFLGYSAFRGIHFSFIAEEDPLELVHTSFEHYFIELLLLYVPALSLIVLTFKHKRNKIWLWVLIYYIVASFLFAGSRSRIVYITLTSFAIIYLYPRPRKPNYLILGALVISLFVLFTIMESARSYSQGLRLDKIESMERSEMTQGASENSSVFWFSSAVMNKYSNANSLIYFEPLVTAVFMPIPRAIFPWKPNGQYLIDTQNLVIGDSSGGAAFMYFVEGYISFGWFGVIFYGWFLGWLARCFWENYRRNPQSIGALLALVLFSASCYGYISRGYLASSYELFIYIVCLPFWIIKIAGRVFKCFRP